MLAAATGPGGLRCRLARGRPAARAAGAARRIVAAGDRGRRLGVAPRKVVHPGLLGGWWLSRPQHQGGHRMKLHANARTCPKSRQEMVRRFLAGRPREVVAAEFAVSTRTVSKWVARSRAEGGLGLLDRSSAPHRVRRTDASRIAAIVALRRLRFTGPEIAEVLQWPLSTTSAILKRRGMGRLGRLGLEPARRYERARPGELIHIDVKKLGRIERGAGKRITGVKRNPGRYRTDAAGVQRQV